MATTPVNLRYNGQPYSETPFIPCDNEGQIQPYFPDIKNCSLVQVIAVTLKDDPNNAGQKIIDQYQYPTTIFPVANSSDPSAVTAINLSAATAVVVRAYVGRKGHCNGYIYTP